MDLEQLLELQDLDTRLEQLRHRLGHDPVRTELAASEAALVALERDELVLFGKRDAVRQELKLLEDEAAMTADKIAKVNATLYGGTVTAHKELEALQHELQMLKERLDDFEDHELEQMEIAEPLDAAAVQLAAAKVEAQADIESRRSAVTVMEAEVNVDLDAVAAQRADLAGQVPEALLSQYERVGAARLAGGRCEGCHLTLPSAEYSEIKRAPADEVHVCPECGRILVR